MFAQALLLISCPFFGAHVRPRGIAAAGLKLRSVVLHALPET